MKRPRTAKTGFTPGWAREDELSALGYSPIIGVDEAGRGPLAGPVVAGAVVLPRDFDSPHFHLLNDSKKLDETARTRLYDEITQGAAWGAGECSAEEIDRINIRQASWLAMQRAVNSLISSYPQIIDPAALYVLVDGLPYGTGPWPYEAIVKGDARSVSIAAGSVIAKVTRDLQMTAYDADFPGYGFARHKGYPTAAHRQALGELGVCVLHRRSFGPVRTILEQDFE